MTTELAAHAHGLRARRSLWLHGGGLDRETWAPMLTDLPRAIAPDLPGHGAAMAATTPRVEAYADGLLPLLEDGMVLIGHSLGGMVALELAVRSPVPLGALVMVEAVPTVRDRWWGRVGPRVTRPLLRLLSPRRLAQLSCLGQSPAVGAEIRRTIGRQSPRQIIDVFDAARFYDGRPNLAKVRLPSLIIAGRQNRATHRGARFAAARIAGATFQMLDGGHLLHIDNPAGLREAIDAFLRHVPLATSASGPDAAGQGPETREV